MNQSSVDSRDALVSNENLYPDSAGSRYVKDVLFRRMCQAASIICVGFLITVMSLIVLRVVFPAEESPETALTLAERFSHLWSFFGRLVRNSPGIEPAEAGYRVGLTGTVWLLFLVVVIAVPIGIGSAVFLEEYCPKSLLKSVVQVNITNLAGVPSIVYGLLGLMIFQRGLGYKSLALGPCLLAGALTLATLILPVMIIATQESLRAVPKSLRLAALALGSTKWQMIRDHLLPAALPGILTGAILGISRAIGETAPLLMVGAAASLLKAPQSPLSRYSALPVEIYFNAREPDPAYSTVAAGGILILLSMLVAMFGVTLIIRRGQRRVKTGTSKSTIKTNR